MRLVGEFKENLSGRLMNTKNLKSVKVRKIQEYGIFLVDTYRQVKELTK